MSDSPSIGLSEEELAMFRRPVIDRRPLLELPSMKASRYHFDFRFPSVPPYDIPELFFEHFLPSEYPEKLVPFREEYHYPKCGVHFYQEDFRFECVWNAPSRYVSELKKSKMVLTPDFSLYSDWPLAAQIWNVYRSRWVGAYWQSHGLRVVPSLAWSDERSFPFAFSGIPQNSVVSVSSVGVAKSARRKALFEIGYLEMLARLKPAAIVWYGTCWINDPRIRVYPFQQRSNGVGNLK